MNSFINANKTQWISQAELLRRCLGLTENRLKVGRLRYREGLSEAQVARSFDNGRNWRYREHEDGFYYDVNRLPAEYREVIYQPSISTDYNNGINAVIKGRKKGIETVILKVLNDPNLVSRWELAYSDLSEAQRKKLCLAAALLEALVGYRIEISARKVDYWKDVESVFYEIRQEGYPYLGNKWRTLFDKGNQLEQVWNEGFDWRKSVITQLIIPKNLGNKPRLKYTDTDVMGWLWSLALMPQNYTGSYIIRQVMLWCEMEGRDCPTFSWFEKVVYSQIFKNITKLSSLGDGKKSNKYRAYVPMANAMFAGDCWHVDSSRVNLIEHTVVDSEGAKVKKSLMMCVIRDSYSGDALGGAFGWSEDRWMYWSALRTAVMEAGYFPYEIVFDRFPGHNSPEGEAMLDGLRKLGVKVTITSSWKGKARVERLFLTLQDVFMQGSKYYYGHGVMSSREYAHRSGAYLTKVKKEAGKEGFDFDAVCSEATMIVNRYRDTKLSDYSRDYKNVTYSPRELHEMSDKPNVKVIPKAESGSSYAKVMRVFGYKKTLNVGNEGMIVTRIEGLKYHYWIEDNQLAYSMKRVELVYDMDDLSVVWLFDEQGRYLCRAGELGKVQLFGPNADYGKLQEIKRLHRERKEYRVNVVEGAVRETPFLEGWRSPKIEREDLESRIIENELTGSEIDQEDTKRKSGKYDAKRAFLDAM